MKYIVIKLRLGYLMTHRLFRKVIAELSLLLGSLVLSKFVWILETFLIDKLNTNVQGQCHYI